MLKSVEGVPMASNPPTSVGIAGAFPAGALVAAAVVLAVVAGAVGAAMVGEVCVVALVVAVDAGLLWVAGDAAWEAVRTTEGLVPAAGAPLPWLPYHHSPPPTAIAATATATTMAAIGAALRVGPLAGPPGAGR